MTNVMTEGPKQTWPELPASLAQAAVLPSDADYWRVRSSYMGVGSPALVLRPAHDEGASDAIQYAAQVRSEAGDAVPFSVRSGGHGIAGTSTNDGGIILDLSRRRDVEVPDAQHGLVRAEAGATWGDVAQALTPHDLALTSGNFGDTGVGGLATAGGVGYFARSQGLTIDHVVRVKLATADGNVRWVDQDHEPDLFWAIRGGGAQAGIAPVLGGGAQIVSYPDIVPTPRQEHTGQQRINMRNVLVDRADAELGDALAETLAHDTTILAELRALGGAVSDVPESETAWAGRKQEVLAATWAQPRGVTRIDESFAPLQKLGTGMYGAYSSDTRPEAAALTWPGDTGHRLRKIAEAHDPELLFDRGLHLRT